MNLQFGRVGSGRPFSGELDEVRIYRRALTGGELQRSAPPGLRFAKAPQETPREVTLQLGGRQFAGTSHQPAFVALRLEAGPLEMAASYEGAAELDRVVLTPLEVGSAMAQRFAAFEKRSPRLGVHLGLRSDCVSTFARVGTVRTVTGTARGGHPQLSEPDVEKDNVNYLAGIREIAVRGEYTDGRNMPRLAIRSVEFDRKSDLPAYARHIIRNFATRAYRRPVTSGEEQTLMTVFETKRWPVTTAWAGTPKAGASL